MPLIIRHLPFSGDLLCQVASDVLRDASGAQTGDLSDVLVLLPSARACKTLGRILLQESGREGLLLPRILTAEQWASEVAIGMGLSAAHLPDDRIRAIILARELLQVPWLADRPENAPSLATEFLDFFDEARRHRRDAMLLQAENLESVLEKSSPQEAEVVAADLERAREVWDLYRKAVPRDQIDHRVEVGDELARLRQAGRQVPGRRYEQCLIAGFGRIDPLRVDVLRAATSTSDRSALYLPEATAPISRLFLATWGQPEEAAPATDPLAGTRRIARAFDVESDSPEVAATLHERLSELDDPRGLLAPTGPLELLPCGDPESESRVITDRVATLLETAGREAPSIGIAVNDPDLAERLYAQLTDAGLDVDNTHGRPLSVQASGLLLRFILRSAVTGLRAEPLLEVLTHPYVRLETGGQGGHGRWTLQLEQIFRRETGPEGGLAGLHRRAEDRDQAALDLFGGRGAGMVQFVTAVADAFAPLLEFGTERGGQLRTGWRELLDAVVACWNALAPKQPLVGDSNRTDIQKAAQLLDDLRWQAERLPPVTLTEFATELGRLLAGEEVAAHRRAHLPVMLTGLVEARLERFDLLIVAGLREGSFPVRTKRPLLLPGALRRRLDLPIWQETMARDAELFLRLLHAAPQVTLTWPLEDQGQPALPSPFVSRLLLALGDPQTAGEVPNWRKQDIPWVEIESRGEKFSAEPLDIPLTESARPRIELSWSALRLWRDCPYRFLLERGFGLRKSEEVRAEFGRKEYGRIVHDVLKDWLDPEGEGHAGLSAGTGDRAQELLLDLAAKAFLPGSRELPVRKLWLDTFTAAVPYLVRGELERFENWRPLALEPRFHMPLEQLLDWCSGQLGAAAAPRLDPLRDRATEGIVLTGGIDRIDRCRDGSASLAVIDYKTGKLPAKKSLQEREELQVVLYAAALEAGALAGADPRPVTGTVAEGIYYPVEGEKAGPPAQPHLAAGADAGRSILVEGALEIAELAIAAADPNAEHPLIPRARRGEGLSTLPCKWCDFRGVCRIEERDGLGADVRRRLDKLVGAREAFGG